MALADLLLLDVNKRDMEGVVLCLEYRALGPGCE